MVSPAENTAANDVFMRDVRAPPPAVSKDCMDTTGAVFTSRAPSPNFRGHVTVGGSEDVPPQEGLVHSPFLIGRWSNCLLNVEPMTELDESFTAGASLQVRS